MDEITKKKFKVEKIIFYNSSNKWGVLATSTIDSLNGYESELLNNYGNITISGNFEGVYEGCELIVSGSIVDSKYGKQIQVKSFKVLADTRNKEGVINFLAKSLIKGISTQNACKIYNKFKEKAIDKVLNEPESLIQIIGIGKKTVEKIKSSVLRYKRIQGLITFCTNLGLPYSLIDKLDEELGNNALSILQSDPYKVMDITSAISFKQIDDIYLMQGGDITSDRRLEVGFLYFLKNIVVLTGSTGCKATTMEKNFYEGLRLQESSNLFMKTLKRLSDNNKIVVDESVFAGVGDGFVFYKKYLDIEKSIAEKIEALNSLGVEARKIEGSTVEEEIHNFPFELNEQQISAIKGCLKHNVCVLTGNPGTGKSSITKALYNIYIISGYNVELLAPTAKACRRLEECIGSYVEAKTLHRFLGIRSTEDEDDPKNLEPLHNTVFIVDEASMVDINLFNHLLTKVELTSKVIIVGDNNQLPSVQAGNVLGDLISSGKVYTAILTEVMRQGEGSNIVKLCTKINNGIVFEPCEFSDFHYEEFGENQELFDFFLKKYEEEVKKYGLSEVQVITPYKKGDLGQNNLNIILQSRFNGTGLPLIEPYRLNDRVRHTRNNYKKEVYNGETGIITRGDEDGEFCVDYGRKEVWYSNTDINELALAYCSTVHASQGSEYKVCFVILDDSTPNDLLLIRRLLYTAVSRGKLKVYILSKPYLLDKCIENNSYRPRITKLKDFLRESSKSVQSCIFS